MLGLAEYTVLSTELWQKALENQTKLNEKLARGVGKTRAVALANQTANNYLTDYENILDRGLREVTRNALVYHQTQLGIEFESLDDVEKKIVDNLYKKKYYGATLRARLKHNRGRIHGVIRKAAVWRLLSQEQQKNQKETFPGLQTLLTEPIPYGSQFNIDRRTLLSMSQKAEQDAAKEVATIVDAKLIRWSLSHRHPKPDICDTLANNVDKSVINYLEAEGLRINPKGVFFRDELPSPPHPNCMCEFTLIAAEKEYTPFQRAVEKIKELWSRFNKSN